MALKRISKGDDITSAFNDFKANLQNIEDKTLQETLGIELKKLQKSVDKLQFNALRAQKDKEMMSSLLKKTSDDLNASLSAEKKFLASMSHEIRTPLNAINGFIELLRKTSLNTKQREFVSNIYVSSDHLLSLINDVLDVSKIEAGQMELTESEVDLEALLMETVMLTSARVKAGVELKIEIPELDFLVNIDALRFKQIFVNLLSNAAKFTKKGFIKLSLDEIKEQADDKVWMKFCVQDSGIGIPKEKVPQLFTAFSQAHSSSHGGTGLGLYLSKSIASVMGGTISLESIEGEGSTFFIEVLLTKGIQRSEQYDFKDKKVLLIEGDENFAKNLALKFDQANANLTHLAKTTSLQELSQEILSSHYNVVIFDLDALGNEIKPLAALINHIFPETLIIGMMQYDDVLNYSDHITILQKPFPFHMMAKLINDSDAHLLANKSSDFSHLKILVVGDVNMNVLLVREMFKTFFHTTFEHAENGEAAVDKAQNGKYDIIFMDIQMPIMDGITATHEIRKFDKTTPIFAMTANALAEDSENTFKSGMNGFITKPIKKEAVNQALISVSPITVQAQVTDKEAKKSNNRNTMYPKEEIAQYFVELGFDDSMLDELLESAVTSLSEAMSDLEEGYKSNNREVIQRAYHSLKGILLNLNCVDLGADSKELEMAIREDKSFDSVESMKCKLIDNINILKTQLI